MVAIPSDTSNQGHKPEAGVLLASVGYDAGLELLFGDAFNLLILVLALALALVIVFEAGFLVDDFLMFATDEAGLSELSIYMAEFATPGVGLMLHCHCPACFVQPKPSSAAP